MKTKHSILVLGAALACILLLQPAPQKSSAAVVPVEQEQDLYQVMRERDGIQLKKQKRLVSQADVTTPQAVIEGLKRSTRKTKRLFSAAQLICVFPIGSDTCTAVCNKASDAVAAVRLLKLQGCDEIRLKAPVPMDILEAIVKTAREQDIRINV